MGEMDRHRYIREQLARDKFAGLAARITGDTFHVVPGASATHITYAKSVRKYVYTTIDEAYSKVVSGRGDALVIWPGSHTPTASITASKDNVSIFGAEAWMGIKVRKPSSIIVAPAADEAFNITGANMEFIGLSCVPVTTKSFADFTGAADGLTVKDCYIDLATPAVNIATEGFTGSAAIDNLLVEGNVVWSDGAQGPAFEITGLNNNAFFTRNHFHVDAGTWASAVNLIDPDGIVVEGDLATCGGTAMTACYTGSGTTVIAGVVFRNNHKGVLVTLFADGFGTTSHAELVNNYTATIGGGTGSALITAST